MGRRETGDGGGFSGVGDSNKRQLESWIWGGPFVHHPTGEGQGDLMSLRQTEGLKIIKERGGKNMGGK